jgi:hypothetical protein
MQTSRNCDVLDSGTLFSDVRITKYPDTGVLLVRWNDRREFWYKRNDSKTHCVKSIQDSIASANCEKSEQYWLESRTWARLCFALTYTSSKFPENESKIDVTNLDLPASAEKPRKAPATKKRRVKISKPLVDNEIARFFRAMSGDGGSSA